MPTTWMAPTRRNALPSDAGNPTLTCDRCPRRTAASLLVDVRALPVTLRGDARYVCDGCWTAWIRQGQIAREDFVRLCGAPDDVVTAAKAFALAHDPIRKKLPVIPPPTP